MLVEDNLREVLMNSDIATIKQFVHVNKASACTDPKFWQDKFKHDGVFIINDHLNETNTKEWINEYEVVLKCKNDCINLLLVNKIESQQTYNQSNRLNISYDEQEINVINHIIGKIDIRHIQIEYDVTQDTYIIYYYLQNSHHIENKIYHDVLNLLIKIMYYSKTKNIKITDNLWSEEYNFNKIIEYNNTVSGDDLVLIQRQTIYDTLKALNLLSG